MVNHGRVVFYKAEISGFFINCDIKSYDDYENLLCIHVWIHKNQTKSTFSRILSSLSKSTKLIFISLNLKNDEIMRVKKISNKKTGNVLNINKLSFQLFCLWQGRRGRATTNHFCQNRIIGSWFLWTLLCSYSGKLEEKRCLDESTNHNRWQDLPVVLENNR